jgi:MPBQ/MSBQ methyltransferase
MTSTTANLDRTKKFIKVMEPKGLNIELLIATEVLGLHSLHYGFWRDGQQVNLANLKLAQAYYTQTLLAMFPKDVTSVLDIGSGIGDNALAMAAHGYKVTAISPDVNHKKHFDSYHNENIKFENCSLENFKSAELFDMFLLSESQTYFDPKVTFDKSKTNLRPGGYILISDIFNKEDQTTKHAVTHTEAQYVAEAKAYGLELIESIDITNEVMPSMELAHTLFTSYILPLTSVTDTYLKATAPIKYKLARFVFKKRISNFSKIVTYYQDRLNPEFFAKNMVYKRLVFKKV